MVRPVTHEEHSMKKTLFGLMALLTWMIFSLYGRGVEYTLTTPVTLSRTIDKVQVVGVTPPVYGDTSGVTHVHVRYEKVTNLETNNIAVSGITSLDIIVPVSRAEVCGVMGVSVTNFNTLAYGVITNLIESIAELKVNAVLDGLQE